MNELLKNLSKGDKDIIKNIIGNLYILDYGFIDSVNSDNTINVKHIGKGQDQQGNKLKDTITKNIEVLFFSCKTFSIQEIELSKDDGVLLVGLKDQVKIKGSKKSIDLEYFLHYEQENIKAILFGFDTNPVTKLTLKQDEIKLESTIKNTTIDLKSKLTLTTDADIEQTATSYKFNDKSGNEISLKDNLIDLKNSVSSIKQEIQKIYDDVNNLHTALNTFAGGNCVNGAPLTTSAAFITTLATLTANLSAHKSAVAALFK